jgi:hypothetical protein
MIALPATLTLRASARGKAVQFHQPGQSHLSRRSNPPGGKKSGVPILKVQGPTPAAMMARSVLSGMPWSRASSVTRAAWAVTAASRSARAISMAPISAAGISGRVHPGVPPRTGFVAIWAMLDILRAAPVWPAASSATPATNRVGDDAKTLSPPISGWLNSPVAPHSTDARLSSSTHQEISA